jgi:hypothetical protein
VEFLIAFTMLVGALLVGIGMIGVDSRDLSDDPHRSSYPVGLD